jgi:hypothetical protein
VVVDTVFSLFCRFASSSQYAQRAQSHGLAIPFDSARASLCANFPRADWSGAVRAH